MVQHSCSGALEIGEDAWPHDWLSDVVYLNNAGEAALSQTVKNAGMEALNRPPWKIDVDNDWNRVRELFAMLIGTDAKNIAIVPSTAFAMTLAARNFQRCLTRTVGRILVVEDQMCSAVYPWQEVCSATDVDIRIEVVPYPDHDGGWTQSILQRIDDDVLLVCVPPLHWSDGALVDLDAVGIACRKHGSTLVIDATQAVGIMPCNVSKCQPSLLACSVHKWLRGPPGISLVYVSPSLHDIWLPLDFHGRSRDFLAGKTWDAWRHEMSPRGYEETFYSDARKFDSGGKANPILIPMLRASMEEVVLLDSGNAQKKLEVLMSPLLKWARNRNYAISPGPHASHLIGIRPPNRTPREMLEICDGLKRRGIHIAVRCGGFRISPYLSNTHRDIERLIQGLEDLGSC